MNAKHLTLSMMLASIAGTAQAAPINQAAELKLAPGKAVKNVEYRCWWRNGYRVCDWYGPRVYDWYYDEPAYGRRGPVRPEDFRTGSKRWWEEMDREDRGGQR
jgi:hypothetical protein